MDVSDGAEAAARGDEAVVGFQAGQLADAADGHRGGRGGVRHPRGARHGVAVIQLSLTRKMSIGNSFNNPQYKSEYLMNVK